MIGCHVFFSFSMFFWVTFHMRISRYFCVVVCKNFCTLIRLDSEGKFAVSNTFLNFFHILLVWVLAVSKFTNFCHVSFLAFLKIIYIITLLHSNYFILAFFVGSCQCFLYTSLSHFSFHHTTVVLFIPVKSYGWHFLLLVVYFMLGCYMASLLILGPALWLLLFSLSETVSSLLSLCFISAIDMFTDIICFVICFYFFVQAQEEIFTYNFF